MRYKVLNANGEEAGVITIEPDARIKTSLPEELAAARVLGMAFANGARCSVVRPDGEKVNLEMRDYTWEVVEFEWSGWVMWTAHNRQDFTVSAPTRKDAQTKIIAEAGKVHEYPLFQGFTGPPTRLPKAYAKPGDKVFIKNDEDSRTGIAGHDGIVEGIRPDGRYRVLVIDLDGKPSGPFDVEPRFISGPREPIEAVKQSNMLHLKASASTTAAALCGREDRGTMFYADGIDDLDALREVEARLKDTDSPLCSNCRERVELSIAFRHAYAWVEDRRRADALGGFDRANEWGPHVLQTFMPEWFQKWMDKANWHRVGLLQGEESWWRYVQAFGLTTDEWWQQVHAAQ